MNQTFEIDSYSIWKPEDGYRNITMADDDPSWHAIVHQAMENAGYTSYGMNRTGSEGKITFTFVTHARAAELKEQHMHSCRNSLGGVLGTTITDPDRRIQLACIPEARRDYLLQGLDEVMTSNCDRIITLYNLDSGPAVLRGVSFDGAVEFQWIDDGAKTNHVLIVHREHYAYSKYDRNTGTATFTESIQFGPA